MFALSSCGIFHYTTQSKLSKALLKEIMTNDLWWNQHCHPLLQKLVWFKNSKKTALKLLLIGVSVLIRSSGNTVSCLYTVCDLWKNPEGENATNTGGIWQAELLTAWSLPPELLRTAALSKGQYCRVQITPTDISTVHSLIKSKINLSKGSDEDVSYQQSQIFFS